MRIRKHAKISPLLYAAASLKPGTVIQTHICRLNQSPWDVITFPPSEYSATAHPSPPPPPPPPPYPVDGYDGFIGNGTFSDYGKADSRHASMNFDLDNEEKRDDAVEVNSSFESNENGGNQIPGNNSSSHYHKKLNGLLSYGGNQMLGSKKHSNPTKTYRKNPEACRGIRRKKPTSSSNPYQYYYYSGFGPRWGKRRGPKAARKVEAESYISQSLRKDPVVSTKIEAESYISQSLKNGNVIEVDEQTTSQHIAVENSLSVQICNDEIDYIEDDGEEEDDEENYGEFVAKKRARKPIKARSLKSLM